MPAFGSPTRPTSASSFSASVEPALLPRQPALGEARRLTGCGGEALVSAAPRPPAGKRRPLAGREQLPASAGEVSPLLWLALDLRARRDADRERLTVGAMAQRALAVPAAPRAIVAAAAEALQVAQRLVAQHEHRSSAPPVAAVRAATRDVGFAAEAHAAVAAGAGLHVDPRSIGKHASILTALTGAGHRNRTRESRMNAASSSTSPVMLITGASSGIGAATARMASQSGWRLVLAARSHERLSALAEELGGGDRALAVRCDVSDWAQQQEMVEIALAEFGRIDVAFANAGFGGPRGFESDTPEHWREMVLTNVYGAALTIRATLPALRSSRGHLLLTSSVAGRRVLPGSFYSVTKHAVTAMGEAARQDVQGSGIRVTLIEPGMTDTPFFEQRPTDALLDEDIARAVLYAISQPAHVDVNEILIRPTEQQG